MLKKPVQQGRKEPGNRGLRFSVGRKETGD
jgi:hypothetical protein